MIFLSPVYRRYWPTPGNICDTI